jgi:excisionase family DNA binding protein
MKYLTISEISRQTNVGCSTLRDWEARALIRADRRGTHRRFSEDDVRRVREIVRLRARGLNPPAIAGVLGPPPNQPHDDAAADSVNIGSRLRKSRHEARLTLKQASALIDVSFSHISAIERGVANPSVALLERLARIYGTTVKQIWGQGGITPEPTALHWRDATLLETDRGRVRAYAVARGRILCGDLFAVDPGGGSEGQYSHEGEEWLHVVEGTVHIYLDGVHEYILGVGESLCFPSDIYHRWMNDGPGKLVMLWTSASLSAATATPLSLEKVAANGHHETGNGQNHKSTRTLEVLHRGD